MNGLSPAGNNGGKSSNYVFAGNHAESIRCQENTYSSKRYSF